MYSMPYPHVSRDVPSTHYQQRLVFRSPSGLLRAGTTKRKIKYKAELFVYAFTSKTIKIAQFITNL